MKTGYAIVLSAGYGSRMGGTIAKQYQLLDEKPVLYYSLKVMEESGLEGIVLVVSEGMQDYVQKEILDKYHINKVKDVVVGGAQRYDSVYAGLAKVPADSVVLVHDSARPFASVDLVQRVYEMAAERGACIPAVPVKDTIKVIRDGNVVCTPDRAELYAAQTPQGFHTKLLLQAYEQFWQQENCSITDDASLVEKMTEVQVAQIPGEEWNIKLTTPMDMLVAQLFVKNKKLQKRT